MTINRSHAPSDDADFPNDVENALVLLCACLADLRIEFDLAHDDDDLRSMLEEHLRQTGFRVATDKQLQVSYAQAAELEHSFQQVHRARLDRLAATVTKRPEPDDLPW